MANKTILQHVNDVLSEMDSRRVSATDETDEAATVRDIMESVFYELQAVRPYRRARRYKSLADYGGSAVAASKVVYDLNEALTIYNGQITEVHDVVVPKYRNDTPLTEIGKTTLHYLFPEDFIAMTNNRNPQDSTVNVIIPSGVSYELPIIINKQPEYYTSFDDRYIVFDSYDVNLLPSGISEFDIGIRAEVEIDFPSSDNSEFTELPRDVIQLVILNTKHRAMIALKNMNNSAIERQMRKLDRYLSRAQKVVGEDFPMANYGRKSAKPSSNWKFQK